MRSQRLGKMKPARSKARQVRYAVVGLGHIAQAAVLPAFAGARKNSKLVALVSGDPVKHRALCKKYKIERAYSYQEYEDCLRNEQVDAVYIALPNHMHREYAVKAAKMGVHVLCEKPLAVTEQDCRAMIETARENRVRLMTAYRLHFEKANLCAIDILKSGKIGEPKLFDSVFTLQVRPGDIRVQKNLGGGTLYDIGIYCINAARYLFRAEPYEVMAFTSKSSDPRFSEVEESSSVLLRFPGARLASFTCSFGSSDVSSYRVVGTKGDLFVEPAYEYAEKLAYRLTVDGKTHSKKFRKRDQFSAELLYFSQCVLKNRQPEPSGEEGLIDVKIIEALYRSALEDRPVRLEIARHDRRPALDQEIYRRAHREPELVHTESPSL